MRFPRIVLALILLASLFAMAARQASSNQVEELLFWDAEDICEPNGVSFKLFPFDKGNMRIILPVDPANSSLWHMPTDVIPHGEDFRVYYQRIEKTQADYINQRLWCMGLLKSDGSFEIPQLNLFGFTQPPVENAVLTRSPHKPTWGGFNVFQTAPGKEGGHCLLYWDQPSDGEAGGMIASSSDGIHWKKGDDHAVFTEHNDAYSLLYHPAEKKYYLYQTALKEWKEKPVRDNLPGMRRVITRRASEDLQTWSPQEDIILPDEMDTPTCEFYLLKAFPFKGRFLGFLMKYYADPSSEGKHSAIYRNELVMSRDGKTWTRPWRSAELGVWTYVAPFSFQGKWTVLAYDKAGMAMLQAREEGLSGCGTEGQGSFITQPFAFPSGNIFLNACALNGEVGIELLNENALPIADCEGRQFAVKEIDAARIPVAWGIDIQKLIGKPVRLKFHLRNAWVSGLTME